MADMSMYFVEDDAEGVVLYHDECRDPRRWRMGRVQLR